MSQQTLKFGDIVVNKREFDASKQAIDLNLVNTSKIVVSVKFRHSDDDFKYCIGYLHDDDDVIRFFCIILPQMSGYKLKMKVCILNTLKFKIKLKSH